MMRKYFNRIAGHALLVLSALPVMAAPASAPLTRLSERVTDFTGKLAPDALSFLSSSIEEGERNSGPRIRAVVIDSCEPEPIDSCAEKLLAAQASDVRPDALLMLQPSAQTARIAVSDSARARISPVAIRVILRESVHGYLRDNNTFSAIEQGTRAIEKAWREQPAADASPAARQSSPTGANGMRDLPLDIPPYAPVVDLSGTLVARDIDGLKSDIAAFRAKKGSQIAVLMLPTTKPESIEELAVRVFEEWKLGRKGIDDGVLILVAKDDRRMRIEVGYGVEAVLTDAVSSRIINERMRPPFRSGDFGGGLTAAVDQITRVIDGEALPPVAAVESEGMPEESHLMAAGVVVVLAVIARFWLPAFAAVLLAAAGIAAVLWLFGAGTGTIAFLAFFGAAIAFGLMEAIGAGRRGRSGRAGRSSWSSDEWGVSRERSSSSSSSSSRDSDSGGGGRSGGGGASGSW
jgi:uncharacterized protein